MASPTAPLAANGAWESFRGGPTHSGDSALDGPAGPLATWGLTGFLPSFSSPVQAPGGTIYEASDGGIQSISQSGTPGWYWNGQTIHGHNHGTHGGKAVLSTPAITPSGNIVFGAESGQVFMVSSGGQGLWTYATGGPIESSPALAPGGTIYIGSDDGRLYALSPNGSLDWTFASSGAIRSSPAIASDGTVIVGSLDGNLYAILPNGSLSWSFHTGGGIFSSPTVTNSGRIVFGSDDDHVYALLSNGTESWNFSTHGAVDSSPATSANGSIIVGSRDGSVYDLAANGSLRWSLATGGDVVSAPAVDGNGTIYVGSNTGMLYALTPAGRTVWMKDMFAAVICSPAIGFNGTLLVVASGGLKALGTRFVATFVESGLAPGTYWSVNLSGPSNSSTTNRIFFNAQELVPLASVIWKVSPSSISCGGGCVIVPVPNQGSFLVKHSLTVNITFERRTVVFQEFGLPNGTLWNVVLGSYTVSSRASQISFTNSSFSLFTVYNFVAGPPQVSCGKGCELEPSPSTGSLGVAQPVVVPIHFLVHFLVQFNRTANHGGTMSPAAGASVWVLTNGTISFSAKSGLLLIFSHWTSSNSSIVIANSNALSTSAVIGGAGNVTAVFVSILSGGNGSGPGGGVPTIELRSGHSAADPESAGVPAARSD